MRHLILTRFNLPLWGDLPQYKTEEWNRIRVDLFQRRLLRSLLGQTVRDFELCVFLFTGGLEWVPEKFDEIARETYGMVRPVYIDRTEAIKDYARERREGVGDLFLTTRIDSDDVVAEDFVERLHNAAQVRSEHATEVLSFLEGITYWRGKAKKNRCKCNQFISMADWSGEGAYALAANHTKMGRNFPVRIIPGGDSMWCWCLTEYSACCLRSPVGPFHTDPLPEPPWFDPVKLRSGIRRFLSD